MFVRSLRRLPFAPLVVLLIVSTLIAGVAPALLPIAQAAATVIIDDPLQGRTSGQLDGPGQFVAGGWRSTGGQIRYETGRLITNGAFEATLSGYTVPAQGREKAHPLSCWETPGGYTHNSETGSFWNWRVGSGYEVFKLLASPQGGDPIDGVPARKEARVGDAAVVNDGQPHRYRVEWRHGTVSFFLDDTHLQTWHFPRFAVSTCTIGRDNWYGVTSPAPIIAQVRITDFGDLPAPPPSTPHNATRVGVQGEQFTINGTPTFLLGVSYFDALYWHARDLDRLADLGYNLIRIWLDWRDGGGFDGQGRLTEPGRRQLLSLIDAADRRGMVVDVTILDTQLSFGKADAAAAVRAVGAALADRTNVIYDLVNEHNHPEGRFTYAEIGDLARILRAVDPDAIVGVSSTGGYLVDARGSVRGSAVASELAAPIAAGMLLPHLARTTDWAAQTGPRVRALRTDLQRRSTPRPIYLQEEARRGHSGLNPSQAEFIRAAQLAREAGAAAWVFHTAAGFTLSQRPFFAALDPVERTTVAALPPAVLGVAPAPPDDGPQPTGTPPAGGSHPFRTGMRIEAEDAQTATERSRDGNAGTAPDYPNTTGLNVNRCSTCSNDHAAALHWGERAGYRVRIPGTASYVVQIRGRASTADRTVSILVDGVALVTDLGIPTTARTYELVAVTSPPLELLAGTHHIEILAPKGMLIDWLQIDPTP